LSQLDHFSRKKTHKPFDEPWHAEVFAVTVHLSERNLFSWAEWTEALGEQISKVKLRRCIDGSNDYYNLWLQALIELISNKGITDAEAILDVQNRWADAFRNTPHGKPIKI
jgi:nitrile hydratase accessory protein